MFTIKFITSKRLSIIPLILSFVIGGCFSHNIGNKFDDPMAGFLKVFVSAATDFGNFSSYKTIYNANCGSFSGIDLANCTCTSIAKGSSLGIYNGRDFKAWLSTTTVDARCNILGQDSNADDCGLTLLDGDGYGPWLNVGSYKLRWRWRTSKTLLLRTT